MDLANLKLGISAAFRSGTQAGTGNEQKSGGDEPQQDLFSALIGTAIRTTLPRAEQSVSTGNSHFENVIRGKQFTAGQSIVTVPEGEIDHVAVGKAAVVDPSGPKLIGKQQEIAIISGVEDPSRKTQKSILTDVARITPNAPHATSSGGDVNLVHQRSKGQMMNSNFGSEAQNAIKGNLSPIGRDSTITSSEAMLRESFGIPSPVDAVENARAKVPVVNKFSEQGSVVSQLAQQLTYAARGGVEHIRFNLHPAELGQVSVQLKIRDGAMKIMISAENTAAVDIMRQSLSTLHQSLQIAGVQVDRDQLQLQQQGGHTDHSGLREDQSRGHGRSSDPDERNVSSHDSNSAEPETEPENGVGLFL